ncbi:MAG: response regulator [Chloroflexi bacterium]|nr:response regulator [Chloroflexota bacterium]
MKVLVAEDQPESQQIIYDILETSGYEVILVDNGLAAVEAALEHKPHLAILDVNMPGKDGFEVVAELKKNSDTAQIPVIMLTAQSDIESRVHGLGLGAEDYIGKPFSPKELLARVNARLRSKAETDELRKQREQVRRIFERFVSPDVVRALMQNPEAAQLGGALREVTVFFADLEGFTTLSEQTDPSTMISIINEYHGLVVAYIKENGGTVDKFTGDGVMAIFNAPLEYDDHALRAVTAACQIKEAMPAFHRHLQPEYRLMVNFGIHTGEAVVGNVGTKDVMNYTAIGDAVNLAQRLQELSARGVITISKSTFDLVGDYIEAFPNGLRRIRGREEMVHTYQVNGLLY